MLELFMSPTEKMIRQAIDLISKAGKPLGHQSIIDRNFVLKPMNSENSMFDITYEGYEKPSYKLGLFPAVLEGFDSNGHPVEILLYDDSNGRLSEIEFVGVAGLDIESLNLDGFRLVT